jgi:hypothetical protein
MPSPLSIASTVDKLVNNTDHTIGGMVSGSAS